MSIQLKTNWSRNFLNRLIQSLWATTKISKNSNFKLNISQNMVSMMTLKKKKRWRSNLKVDFHLEIKVCINLKFLSNIFYRSNSQSFNPVVFLNGNRLNSRRIVWVLWWEYGRGIFWERNSSSWVECLIKVNVRVS